MNRFHYQFSFNDFSRDTRNSLYRIINGPAIDDNIKTGAKILRNSLFRFFFALFKFFLLHNIIFFL